MRESVERRCSAKSWPPLEFPDDFVQTEGNILPLAGVDSPDPFDDRVVRVGGG